MIKDDEQLLRFVYEQIVTLETYYTEVDELVFLEDTILQDACLMKLLVIGEYTSKLSESFKDRFTEVEWQILKAARNYYAHAYGSITWLKVWNALTKNIPDLKRKFENIIEVLESEKQNAKTNQ